MDGTMGMGMGLLAILWGLVGLAVLALLVLAIMWLIRSLTNQGQLTRQREDPAEAELRRRYAAGELDREEYQRRLGDLRGP
ncbi:SHOCT domain-containing protein [Saccharopolyspora sp. ID03-671]|uniref:SHOCT domain-containing protein n=1 Tax=Saccharopolyspora sp. ID03-671 TaxID=3073066 RepID=UPI0032566742